MVVPSIFVSGPLLTSVMLKCFLVKLLINFGSCSAAGAAAAGAATPAATGTASTSALPPRAPTGIWRSISLPSPMWIFSIPPGNAAATGAAGISGAATAGACASSASAGAAADGAFTPSNTSAVSGARESQVFVSFAPRTSSIVKHPSRFNNPESTKSSKIAGSSRFAGSIVMPASALQQSTAGS